MRAHTHAHISLCMSVCVCVRAATCANTRSCCDMQARTRAHTKARTEARWSVSEMRARDRICSTNAHLVCIVCAHISCAAYLYLAPVTRACQSSHAAPASCLLLRLLLLLSHRGIHTHTLYKVAVIVGCWETHVADVVAAAVAAAAGDEARQCRRRQRQCHRCLSDCNNCDHGRRGIIY